MKAIVTGDAEYVVRSFDNLPPGAHVAVRTSPTQLPDSGIALRLAEFEIRDTIAHIVGDRIVWWILARKPLDGTVAANVLAHGVGGLNIDASRVGTEVTITKRPVAKSDGKVYGKFNGGEDSENPPGRFPANVLLDEHAAKEMDEQSGVSKSPPVGSMANTKGAGSVFPRKGRPPSPNGHGDSGGASRFFPTLNEDEAENWIRKLIDPDYPE